MVIFLDLDGVIVDPSERLYRVYTMLVDEFGGTTLPKTVYWQMKKEKYPVPKILKESGLRENSAKSYSERKQDLLETPRFLEYDRIIPGANHILGHLSKAHQLVLVTLRNSKQSLAWELDCLGISSYCSQVLSSGSDVRPPWETKVNLIKAELGSLDAECMIVGDTETEILAGRNLGIHTVAVLSGIRTRQVLEEYEPAYIIESIIDLNKVIRSLKDETGDIVGWGVKK